MGSKLINWIKNNKLYWATFLIGVFIVGFIYQINNVTPLGTNSLLCVDFYHQYGPMLGELYDRLHSFSNFTYSFSMGLGLPFFRNFLNYLSSPFNIIMLFFNRNNLITSYSFIIGLKAICASVTMVYYLSKKFNTKKLYLIPLGIIYAFQAYFSAYYWNIMWLDGLVFLPLITLGIESIVKENKWKLYTFSLAIMLIANYFIGYMICVFSVVYFIFYNIYKFKLKKGEIKNSIKIFFQRCLTFGICSIIAGMLSAAFLLPMAESMTSISATGGTIPTSQYYAFEVVDYLFGHLTGVETTVFASDLITNPNISCGILSVALLLLYLINIDIPLKNKICYLLILGFFIACFFSPQLDYVMHAFHVPNDLPYRYSFLYSFVLITICAYSLINVKKINFPMVALSYVFLIVLLLLVKEEGWQGITTNMIYINMILLSLYFVFYACYYFTNRLANLFYIGIIAIASVDVIVSINYNWDITQVLSVFYQDYEATEELLDYVKNYDNGLFYRIENTSMMTLNDASWYNYYGMTTFSSMAYENMAILQHNLGMPGNEINSYYFVQSTPIYDLMFDIKYFIGSLNDHTRYQEIKTIEETANEFIYNVGLAFGVNKDITNWDIINANPFAIQNEFIYLATGIDNVLEPSTLISTEEVYSDSTSIVLKYQYENPYDNMYFYADDYNIDFIIIGDTLYYKNDNYERVMENNSDLYYAYLDDYGESNVINIYSGEEVIDIYVSFNIYYNTGFSVYNINNDAFVEAYNYLNRHKFDMTSFREDEIIGNISVDEDMYVYTSIPYDKGWHVYIDNKEVETESLQDTLLIFKCDSGTHSIRFKYRAPYSTIGKIISLLTLIGIIIECRFGKRIRNKFKKIKD